MRKVILSAAVSLDGYIARPDGSFDFIPSPDTEGEAGKELAQLFASVDVFAIGRKTLDDVRLHTGSGPPKGAGTTYIFSRTLAPGEKDGLVFVNQSAEEFVADRRSEPGKHIFLMGGGELARCFLEADLVDELLLAALPVLLGEGIRLFPAGFPQRDLTLVQCLADPNGTAMLKYERTR